MQKKSCLGHKTGFFEEIVAITVITTFRVINAAMPQ